MAKERPCKLCPGKRWGNSSWCYTHHKAREKERREATKEKRLARKLASKKHQQSELKKWRAKCWKLMSEWVRRSVADWRGNINCFTCNAVVHYKNSHASHFFHGKLDYDSRNLRACCIQCNLYLSGNLAQYAIRLTQENGLAWVEKLRSDAAQHPGYDLETTKRIYEELRAKIDSLPKP